MCVCLRSLSHKTGIANVAGNGLHGFLSTRYFSRPRRTHSNIFAVVVRQVSSAVEGLFGGLNIHWKIFPTSLCRVLAFLGCPRPSARVRPHAHAHTTQIRHAVAELSALIRGLACCFRRVNTLGQPRCGRALWAKFRLLFGGLLGRAVVLRARPGTPKVDRLCH